MSEPRRAPSRGLLLVFLAVLTAPFWDLGHPLWEVDDARYAEIPREMHERGDWLTPSLNYVDYVEKPPLIYWLSAASYSIFGVSEGAARLPLALLAAAGILGVWWLGSWLYSGEIGLLAGILLGTCVQFFALSHMITPDMALSVSLLWATGLILRCLHRPRDGTRAGALAWIALTAAFLSKGLVALVLPAVWTAALVLLFPRLRGGLRPLFANWGLPLFLALAGGWLWAMESRNPGFLRFFFVEQHFLRYLTPQYNRPGPWYYFAAVIVVGSLPWTPLTLAGVLSPLRRFTRAPEKDLQLALWIGIVFLFFSASSSKLPTYILPLFAHQALLGARFWTRREQGGAALWTRRTCAAFGGGLLLVCAAAPFAIPRLSLGADHPGALGYAIIAVLGLLGAHQLVIASSAEVPRARAGALALAIGALLLGGSRCLTSRLSVRDLGTALRARADSLESEGVPARILAYDKYLHGLPFYARRPVDVINWVGELHYAKRMPRYSGRFGDDDTVRRLPSPEGRTFLVTGRRSLAHVATLVPIDAVRGLETHGPWLVLEY